MTSSVRHQLFGSVAEQYERFRPGYGSDLVDLLVADTPRTALEVGAGTGKATRAVASRGIPVTAVGPDPAMVAVLRRQTRGLPVSIVPSTFEEVTADPVDLLYAAAAFHWTDPLTRWGRASGLLRPGGTLAIFGGQTDLADRDLDDAVDRVRRESVGDVNTSGARPDGRDEPWPGNELASDPRFHEIRVHDLTSTYSMAADNWIGLMSTVSAFIALSDDLRREVLARIRGMLPDSVEVRYEFRLHLARRG